MKLSFKVSRYTIIFSLYVIISASFMYQLLNFIRYDLWIPKRISYENYQENILERLYEIKKDKEKKIENNYEKNNYNDIKKSLKDIIKKIYIMKKNYVYNHNDRFYYLNKNTPLEDKEQIRYVFLILDKKDILPIFIFIVFFTVGCIFLIYLFKLKIHYARIICACIIFVLGLLYTLTINKHISERIHLIYFGIIGFLFAKDNFKELGLLTIAYTILWALIIASLDEIFQLYLPKRVGDIRDIIFGISGGLWGGIIYIILYIEKIFKFNILKKG